MQPEGDGPRCEAEGIARRTFDFIGPVSSARPGLQHVHGLVRPGPVGLLMDDVLVQLLTMVGQLHRQVWQEGLTLCGWDLIR